MTDPIPYAAAVPGTQPPLDSPSYGSTHRRAPRQEPIRAPFTLTEATSPRFVLPSLADMSKVDGHAAMGERIIVAGRVLDERGTPLRGSMVEVWQANSAGRYHHARDQHDAPLDPHFQGQARVFTDDEGWYRFTTIRPGAYPWRNHPNAWRPTHIHFSLFGQGFAQRLITQMYFPGDPLLPLDPIFLATADEAARNRLVASFDLEITQPEFALGYRFDITLRGPSATPFEDGHEDHA
jgi:protocatechuate 3,4-dioxygenase beta subunit